MTFHWSAITIDCAGPGRLADFWSARLHVDLAVPDIDAGVATVPTLGGRTLARHDYDEGVVVVMADPEGNEFCLVQYY